MAAQSPPFALQNSAHSAALFRQAVSSFLQAAGVLAPGDMAVTAQSTPNMSVQVAAGRAWMTGTQVSNVAGGSFSTQAAYFGLNDAPATVTIATANATNPRIDVVYAAVQDSFYSGSNNQLVIGVVTGTPAASPIAPAVPTNAVALATVAVAANATSIVGGNIASFTTASSGQAGVLGTPLIFTSTTHPTDVRIGQLGWESDTGNLLIATAGTGTATTWKAYASTSNGSWVSPALAGFTDIAGRSVEYRLDRTGIVWLRGGMTNALTFSAPSATIFTLPSGYRPGQTEFFVSSANISGSGEPFVAQIEITSSGAVSVAAFSGTASAGQAFAVDGISFLAEN